MRSTSNPAYTVRIWSPYRSNRVRVSKFWERWPASWSGGVTHPLERNTPPPKLVFLDQTVLGPIWTFGKLRPCPIRIGIEVTAWHLATHPSPCVSMPNLVNLYVKRYYQRYQSEKFGLSCSAFQSHSRSDPEPARIDRGNPLVSLVIRVWLCYTQYHNNASVIRLHAGPIRSLIGLGASSKYIRLIRQ